MFKITFKAEYDEMKFIDDLQEHVNQLSDKRTGLYYDTEGDFGYLKRDSDVDCEGYESSCEDERVSYKVWLSPKTNEDNSVTFITIPCRKKIIHTAGGFNYLKIMTKHDYAKINSLMLEKVLCYFDNVIDSVEISPVLTDEDIKPEPLTDEEKTMEIY